MCVRDHFPFFPAGKSGGGGGGGGVCKPVQSTGSQTTPAPLPGVKLPLLLVGARKRHRDDDLYDMCRKSNGPDELEKRCLGDMAGSKPG